MAVRVEERDGNPVWVWHRLYCKRWSCPFCGPIKAAKLCRAITIRAREHELSRFLTLTLDPKKAPRDGDRLLQIRDTWRKFRVYVKRKHGENLSFISVVEAHKNGIPHMHVLVGQYLAQRWVSSTWDRLGGGYIVHIERIPDLNRVGWYLGKYFTKDLILSAGKGVRRYSTSRDIKLFDKSEDSGFKLVNTRLEDVREGAGKMVVNEEWDSLGHLKSFITPGPVDKMKLAPKDREPTEDEIAKHVINWWDNQRGSYFWQKAKPR